MRVSSGINSRRKFSILALSIAAAALSGFSACTNAPCRQLKHPELAMPSPTPTPADAPVDGANPATPAANSGAIVMTDSSAATDGRVLVGRPDGSLQCGMAKGKSPEEMEKELDGIKVYARSKRPDGRMHIQVCGSPTGQLNVYEIPTGSLKEAERRGFKKFVAGS
jgi:hypothetical protein